MWSVEVHMFSQTKDSSCSTMSCGHHDQIEHRKGSRISRNSHLAAMRLAHLSTKTLWANHLCKMCSWWMKSHLFSFFKMVNGRSNPWNHVAKTLVVEPPPSELSSSSQKGNSFRLALLLLGKKVVSCPTHPLFWREPGENYVSLSSFEIKPWIGDGFTMIWTLEHPSFPSAFIKSIFAKKVAHKRVSWSNLRLQETVDGWKDSINPNVNSGRNYSRYQHHLAGFQQQQYDWRQITCVFFLVQGRVMPMCILKISQTFGWCTVKLSSSWGCRIILVRIAGRAINPWRVTGGTRSSTQTAFLWMVDPMKSKSGGFLLVQIAGMHCKNLMEEIPHHLGCKIPCK